MNKLFYPRPVASRPISHQNISDGECEVQGILTLENILRPHALEERIYRMRYVEAWSMLVPWIGFPLSELVKRYKPTSNAKFMPFPTLLDPRQMPGERARS